MTPLPGGRRPFGSRLSCATAAATNCDARLVQAQRLSEAGRLAADFRV